MLITLTWIVLCFLTFCRDSGTGQESNYTLHNIFSSTKSWTTNEHSLELIKCFWPLVWPWYHKLSHFVLCTDQWIKINKKSPCDMVFTSAPWLQLSKLWNWQVFSLWDFFLPFPRVWMRVPVTYRCWFWESGWNRWHRVSICEGSVRLCGDSIGTMSKQVMPVLGSLVSETSSKQPLRSFPRVSWLSIG